VALGCRVSLGDSDALAAALDGPFRLAGAGERADYVVVSTCTVTADADAAARQAVRRAARDHPGAAIVAAGCCAELRPEELRALPGVAAVVGTRSPLSVREVLEQLRGRTDDARRASNAPWQERALAPGTLSRVAEEGRGAGVRSTHDFPAPPLHPLRHTRALLKIQDGCDARCAYCVVPQARGPARSLPFDDALARLAALGRARAEVVLSGVHLGAYGGDLWPRRTLAELVAAAAERLLVHRVRLSSIEVEELPLEVFRGPARPLLCEHVHLPLQSGSASVLRAMRRASRPAAFARRVAALAAAVPGACIGADVMTGFPGETEADHRATVALVEDLPFAYLHVFPFSPRPGTEAAAMSDSVAPAVTRARARELADLSARRWRLHVEAHVGHEAEVVVERVEGGVAVGTARTFVRVAWAAASGERRGDLVRVRVDRTDGDACTGADARLLARPGGR
jgi:threonylcarbamoyladenosine tRNA methylthiotransferase MtaB